MDSENKVSANIAARLWNSGNLQDRYDGDKFKYQEHTLEQYKIYVEGADRISARRMMANTFFLTINTALIPVVIAFGKNYDFPAIIPVCIAVIVMCYVWVRLLKSYRQLNSAKYKVIGQIEKSMPASPYSSAEWNELGEGKDKKLYTPLTALEKWIPIVFMILYVYIAVVSCFLIDDSKKNNSRSNAIEVATVIEPNINE